MSQRFAPSALVIALFVVFASASSAETDRDHRDHKNHKNHLTGKLAVPLTGSVEGGGTFEGTLTIQRFAVRHGEAVAIGAIGGTLRTPAASGTLVRTLVHALVELPVTVEAATGFQRQRGSSYFDPPTIRFVQATCGIVDVTLGGTDLDLVGLTLHLDPVVLALSGDSAGVLGNLACQLLGLVNNVVGLVGVLNAILGLLSGLLGGLSGALPV